jgi:hypothetical protein
MAGQIFPSTMAAMLRGSQIPPMPMGPPPEVMLGAPTITMSELLRAEAMGGPAMAPATMTGRENGPQQPPMALPASVDIQRLDYGQPMAGTRPLAEGLPGVFPERERGYYRPPAAPTTGIAAGPQSAREAFDLAQQGRDMAFVGSQALPMAVGGPASRGVDAMVRGAGALGRAALASPPGQWVVRNVAEPVAGTIARNPTLAGFLSAGGATLATPGETADAPPLRERAPDARKAEADVRGRLATAEEDLRKAREDVARYDDRSFNWRDPDAVEGAQRNFQGLGIQVRDPKTGQMVPVPSDRRDGPLTRQGAAEYARRAAARVKDLETGIAATRTELERAGTAVKEAEGLDAREVSSRRMRELSEPTFAENWGPMAGYLLGGAWGYAERAGIAKLMDRASRIRTERANALLGDVGAGSANERAARMNQFWSEGGSRNPPFVYTPGARPYPWTTVPDAPPRGASSMFTPRDPAATLNAAGLYQPSAMERFGPFAAVAGQGGAEWAIGSHLLENAKQEYDAANAAIAGKDNPTEVEMERLVTARQRLAQYDFLRRFGQGQIGGAFIRDTKAQAARANQRPSVNRAEAERADIDLLLNPPPALPAPPAGPSGPAMLPHSSTYQPRAGGRFAPGRPVYPPGDPRR